MKKYSRVSYEQRCQIHALLQAKVPIITIAKQLGFHKSTIYREVKRNSTRKKLNDEMSYDSFEANKQALIRFWRCRRPLKVQGDLEQKVVNLLRLHLSPEQISGRLKREVNLPVSHQSIYNFIRRRIHYAQYLQYKGMRFYRHRRNKKHGNEYWAKHISERPVGANNRSRMGHWERDLMYVKDRKPILVCTDRKSRFTKLKGIEAPNAFYVREATHEVLDALGQKVRSVTNDNGPEFKTPASCGHPMYFCDPYRPQQRGTVENTIGVIRRFIKSKTNIKDINLDKLENWLNLRPRKVLDYQTPYEVFYKRKVALVI